MSTTRTEYRVLVISCGKIMSGLHKQFASRKEAQEWGDDLLADIKSNRLMYTIKEVEVPAPFDEFTPEELRAEWRRVHDLMDGKLGPLQSDPMGVADDFVSFPGDLEMWSDYGSEVSKVYTRKTGRCIVTGEQDTDHDIFVGITEAGEEVTLEVHRFDEHDEWATLDRLAMEYIPNTYRAIKMVREDREELGFYSRQEATV